MTRPPVTAPPDDAALLLAAARACRERGELAAALAPALAAQAVARDAVLRAEAGLLACACHYRLGDLAALLDLGPQVLVDLPASSRRNERAELLRWLTLAGAETGRFEQAMAAATEHCALADASDDDALQALALNALAVCFERMGDPWQAERLMLDGLAHAERQDQLHPKLVTLNNLAAVTIGAYHLHRDVDEAEARGALLRALGYARRAQQDAAAVTDTFFHVFIDGNVGEALLHLGDVASAEPLLQRALQLALDNKHLAQSWRIRCTLAEGRIAQGDAAAAEAQLTALQSEAGAAMPQATRLRLHQTRWRACQALGRFEDAFWHLHHSDRLQRERATLQLRAQSQLLVTRAEAERARQQARSAQAQADEQARHARLDALTGLANRRQVDERLPGLLAQAARSGRPLALALVDADHFKRVNDRHGHRRGDQVLVALARLLREGTRDGPGGGAAGGDLLARLGGEEFLIVLPDTAPELARQICERLRQRVEAHAWAALARGLQVTVSIGLAHAPPHEAAALFEQADRALYRAKQDGRNRVQEYDGSTPSSGFDGSV